MIQRIQPLVHKEWREGRWKRLIAWPLFVLLGAGVPLLYGQAVSILQEQAGTLPFGIEIPPESLEYANYVVDNWMKSMYETIVVLALILGANTFAGEFNRGTITLLWTRPVPRPYVAYAKWFVDIGILSVAALLHTVATDVLSRIVHETALPAISYVALIPLLAGTAIIYGIAMLCSARMDDPIRAGGIATAIALFISVPSWISSLRWASVYVQMTAPSFLSAGQFPWLPLLVMTFLAAALLWATCRVLLVRDV